ncbi:hypothetical protein AAC387_Pa02g2466 [Persea americana]
MAKTHEDIQNKLEENNAKYKKAADVHRHVKVFKEDDLVWVYMNNDRFPLGSYNMLKERKVGSCQVLKKINDNSYKDKLPPHIHTILHLMYMICPFLMVRKEKTRGQFLAYPDRMMQ